MTQMDIPEHIGTYTHEFIMQWQTDGTDEWNATRKERITRCGDCLFYSQALLGTPYGYCKGRRKYETGFCDEAIRRT